MYKEYKLLKRCMSKDSAQVSFSVPPAPRTRGKKSSSVNPPTTPRAKIPQNIESQDNFDEDQEEVLPTPNAAGTKCRILFSPAKVPAFLSPSSKKLARKSKLSFLRPSASQDSLMDTETSSAIPSLPLRNMPKMPLRDSQKFIGRLRTSFVPTTDPSDTIDAEMTQLESEGNTAEAAAIEMSIIPVSVTPRKAQMASQMFDQFMSPVARMGGGLASRKPSFKAPSLSDQMKNALLFSPAPKQVLKETSANIVDHEDTNEDIETIEKADDQAASQIKINGAALDLLYQVPVHSDDEPFAIEEDASAAQSSTWRGKRKRPMNGRRQTSKRKCKSYIDEVF